MPDALKKPRYFYGWNIVAVSFLARISYAQHFTSILGLFFKPMQNELGWSRSGIAGVQTTARVIEALLAPAIGPLIDRYGPRLLMPIGALVVGLAMLAVTRIDALWQFYMLRGVVTALGFTFMGALVMDVAVNNWFVRKRGRALAIARIGGNFSNFLMVPICIFVIAHAGWRTMFVIFALTTWAAVLLPSALIMRRRPEDIGLRADGDDPDVGTDSPQNAAYGTRAPKATPEREWTRREAMSTASFWLIVISFGINSMTFQGINISLAPFIQDLGYTNTMLAVLMTFRSAVQVPFGLVMGLLAEKADRTSMRFIPFLILTLAAILFCFVRTPVFLWLAIATYGLGAVGANIMQEVLWANYFGRLSLGRVRSLGYLLSFGFGAVGPLAMNLIFDAAGSYRPAFIIMAGLFALAAVLISLARPIKSAA